MNKLCSPQRLTSKLGIIVARVLLCVYLVAPLLLTIAGTVALFAFRSNIGIKDETICIGIAAVILLVSGPVSVNNRKRVFEKDQFEKGKRRKEAAGWLNSNWSWLVLRAYYALIFAGLVSLVFLLYGKEHLLEGLVVGTVVTLFIVFQLPHILRPNMYVVYLRGIERSKTYEDIPCRDITVTAGRVTLLYFRITNLGVNNYQNCTFWFIFPKGLVPLEDPNLYNGVDFRKEFQLQRRTRTVLFPPDKNYQTVTPGNSLYFPIWVQTPQALDNTNKKVSVSATCETRRGEFRKTLKVNVV